MPARKTNNRKNYNARMEWMARKREGRLGQAWSHKHHRWIHGKYEPTDQHSKMLKVAGLDTKRAARVMHRWSDLFEALAQR